MITKLLIFVLTLSFAGISCSLLRDNDPTFAIAFSISAVLSAIEIIKHSQNSDNHSNGEGK